MRLENSRSDVVTFTGEVNGWLDLDEPFPKARAIKEHCPGLYIL